MLTGAPVNNYGYVVGAYTGEDNNTYRIITVQKETNRYYVNGNSKAGGGSVIASGVAANVIHEGLITNGAVQIDGVNIPTTTTGSSFASSAVISILHNGFVGRIYGSYAKQNGVLKYNMIPVRRNSDSKCGMYDTVSKTFFGSATSTAFTCP